MTKRVSNCNLNLAFIYKSDVVKKNHTRRENHNFILMTRKVVAYRNRSWRQTNSTRAIIFKCIFQSEISVPIRSVSKLNFSRNNSLTMCDSKILFNSELSAIKSPYNFHLAHFSIKLILNEILPNRARFEIENALNRLNKNCQQYNSL